MKWKAKTRIVVETYRRELIPWQADRFVAFCEACGCEASYAPAPAVAARSGFGLRRVFRLIEAGSIHCVEPRPGQVWVCDESARQALDPYGIGDAD